MRLALVLEQCLAPVPGGTGRYSAELAAALARSAPDGASVAGWTSWHLDTRAARVKGVAGPRRLPLPRRPLVAAWERRRGPVPHAADLVHAPTLLAPPPAGRPLVVSIHDAVPWSHPETLTARGVVWHRRMAGLVARTADLVVVPTAAVADELARVLPLGDRVLVVGEGVSDALRLPADAAARAAAMGLPERYFLTLATLEPRKGLDVVMAALADPAAPDVPLLVAGQPGWGGLDPVAEAARLGLAPGRVRLLGRRSDVDLAVLLDRALALLAPSRAEGFGLPVLEAMAAGLPALTSDAPALVEVGGGATLVVPRGDVAATAAAMRALAEDGGLRAQLAAAGLIRSTAYSWDAAAAALWTAYADLAG
ncbi:MAG: glycosyltransferase family 4 protein [Actinomycetota bacterium]|nr:glycosyltransferase family 4 protein [Actinomycetota bacterium]